MEFLAYSNKMGMVSKPHYVCNCVGPYGIVAYNRFRNVGKFAHTTACINRQFNLGLAKK